MSVISQFQIVNFNQSNNNPILNQSLQSRDQLLKNYLNMNKLPTTYENKANHDASKQSIDQLLYQSGCMDDNDICELCNEPFDQHDVDMNFELNYQIQCYQDVLQNTTYNQSIVTQHQQQLKQRPIQQKLENAKHKKKLNIPYETTSNQFLTAKQNRDFNRDLYSSKLSKALQTRSQTRMSQFPNASQKNLELKSRGQKSMEYNSNFQNYHSAKNKKFIQRKFDYTFGEDNKPIQSTILPLTCQICAQEYLSKPWNTRTHQQLIQKPKKERFSSKYASLVILFLRKIHFVNTSLAIPAIQVSACIAGDKEDYRKTLKRE
eukprot:403367733